MSLKGTDGERLLTLERRFEEFQRARVETESQRPHIPESSRVRPARVANATNPGDNTFDIIFIDGKFTETAGNQTPTWTDRQAAAGEVAYNLTGEQLNQGDLVEVFKWAERWYLDRKSVQQDPSSAIVRIDDSPGINDCEPSARLTECTWAGFKVNVNAGGTDVCTPYSDGDAIWIMDVNKCVPVTSLNKAERYVANRIGIFDPGADPRELWAIKHAGASPAATNEYVAIGSAGLTTCADQSTKNITSCIWEGRLTTPDNIVDNDNLCPGDDTKWSFGADVWIMDIERCYSPSKLPVHARFKASKVLDAFETQTVTKPLYAIQTQSRITKLFDSRSGDGPLFNAGAPTEGQCTFPSAGAFPEPAWGSWDQPTDTLTVDRDGLYRIEWSGEAITANSTANEWDMVVAEVRINNVVPADVEEFTLNLCASEDAGGHSMSPSGSKSVHITLSAGDDVTIWARPISNEAYNLSLQYCYWKMERID